MDEQERRVIDDIFRRLEQVANQQRDPEAERYIADKLRQQPYAPYAMAQSVYIQEQALERLQAENEGLRAELDQMHQRPQGGGGFLSSIFGGGSRPQASSYQGASPRQGSPWGAPGPQGGYRQQPYGAPQGGMMGSPMGGGSPGPWGGAMQPRAGGGFLQSALTTAAGVAGGMMIANALSHAFQGDEAAKAATGLAGLGGADQPAAADNGAAGDTGNAGITDALYPAGQNQQDDGGDNFADFGGDGGDDGDWA